jgi:hypothetical protein
MRRISRAVPEWAGEIAKGLIAGRKSRFLETLDATDQVNVIDGIVSSTKDVFYFAVALAALALVLSFGGRSGKTQNTRSI